MRVTVVIAHVALAAALAGFSPFRAEEKNVREGNERLASGDPDGALRRYEEAEKAVGPRPEIDYDRGNALFRQGQGAQARDAWQRSREEAPGSLSSRASQNIGTSLAGEGDREGAIAAFMEALRRDPRNEDARFNLEVMLRRRQEEEQQQQQQQQQQQRMGQRQEQPRPEGRDGRRTQQPPPGAPQGRGREEGGEPPDERQRSAGEASPEGEGRELSRREAERILDAFRGQERMAPPPRAERHGRWRTDDERDW